MRPLRGERQAPPAVPGPSRTAYRLARAWARPQVRALAQVYLPLVLLAVAGWAVVSNDRLRLAIRDAAADVAGRLAERPELAVKSVEIVGAPPDLRAEIDRAVGPVEGLSALSLDVAGLRARIEAIGAVAQAQVRLSPKGHLEIAVERRTPVALWRDGEGALHLIDADGVAIREVGLRIVYPELPLMLGDGAPGAVADGLALLEAAPDLRRRIRALVRVGERRWDVALSGGVTVMLPETNAEAALAGIMALHYAEDLFDRALDAVDLRVPARPTLRPRPPEGPDDVLDRAIAARVGEDT